MDDKTMPHLESCPFCNGEVYRCGTKPDDIHSCHYIVCDNCGEFDLGRAADPNNEVGELDELNRKIAEAWNRRAAASIGANPVPDVKEQ